MVRAKTAAAGVVTSEGVLGFVLVMDRIVSFGELALEFRALSMGVRAGIVRIWGWWRGLVWLMWTG